MEETASFACERSRTATQTRLELVSFESSTIKSISYKRPRKKVCEAVRQGCRQPSLPVAGYRMYCGGVNTPTGPLCPQSSHTLVNIHAGQCQPVLTTAQHPSVHMSEEGEGGISLFLHLLSCSFPRGFLEVHDSSASLDDPAQGVAEDQVLFPYMGVIPMNLYWLL